MPSPLVGDEALGEALPVRDPITRLPILILDPHARCNCRCLMCDIWKEREPRELSTAEVAEWSAGWRALGVTRVVLSGGEPLMHSDLWSLCRTLADAGIGITLLSSGLLLERDAAAIARHVDDLVVSLDGPPQVHDAIRNVPRAFERLAAGVHAVREAARVAGTAVSISARCTVQRRNASRLRETVAAAREAGFDRLSFLAADVSSDAFNRPGGWSDDEAARVALTREELGALETELDALEREHAADFASGFLAESPTKLRARLAGHFAARLGVGTFVAPPCNAPWVSSVIEADGSVRPCFFHPAVGNVREAGSLEAVLNGPKALAFRQGLDVASNPVCRRCVCSLNLREAAPPGAAS